jgi:peptidyl-dipeptidase Dcp
MSDNQTAGNPFFEEWTGPFAFPPFDRIRAEHFVPAFERFMPEELAEVDAIADNPEPPTFANTIEALERTGRMFDRVTSVFGNLTASCTTDELDAIDLEYAPKFAQHGMAIALNLKLFARIDDLYRRRDTLGLDTDQMRLLERRHLRLVRSGAQLDEAGRKRMSEISEQLATLQTQFAQNALHDEKEWVLLLDEGDLAGLPQFLVEGAAASAKERGHEGRYAITLSRSSFEPFLSFSSRRDLRQLVCEAWATRGEHEGAHDNRPLIGKILALRQEKARLLGYSDFVAFKLADSMAQSVEAAEGLLRRIWGPAKAKAAVERRMLEQAARDEGANFDLEPWDWRYYAEKVRQSHYDLDDAEVKPYFVLENMVQAMFDTATKLFGVTFHERPDLPVYHPDVKVYEVREGDRHVGVFLQDIFARTGKYSGAWMSSFRDQQMLDGEVSPIIINNNNLLKADPTLLGFTDAETLFHEFGHGLHGLLSRVRYPSQSGTSVRRDFVEFPSQVYEHWMSAPDTLRKYARHYQTGEPIPEALLKRLLAAQTFNQGFGTVEFTACALADIELHRLPHPETLDPTAFEAEFLAEIGMPRDIMLRHRLPHFRHLFEGDGYAVGYYAYMWAETLDADGYDAFVEAGNVFDPDLAAKLKTIYSSGDSRDPMELYRQFRGRDPDVEALLKYRGLEAEAAQ